MATSLGELEIQVRANTKAIEEALVKLEEQGDKAGQSFGDSFSQGFGLAVGSTITNQIIGAVQAVPSFLSQSVDQAVSLERVLGGVQGVLDATGNAAGLSLQDIDELAQGLGRSTLTNRQSVLEASRALLTFKSVQGDTFARAINAANDLSEVLGSDLTGSTIQVAKALENPINGIGALGEAGVTFTEEQKLQIQNLVAQNDLLAAQNIILEVIESQVKGTAEAAAQGFGGAVDTFNEELDQLRTTIGGVLADAFTPLTQEGSTAIADIRTQIEAIAPTLQQIAVSAGQLTADLFGLFAAGLKLAADNADLLQLAIATLTVRFLALKAIGLAASIQASVAAIVAQTVALGGTASAATVAAVGLAKLRAATLSFIASAAPLAAIAVALVGIKVAADQLKLSFNNVDLEGFIAGAEADLNNAFSAAGRTAELNDAIAEAKAQGLAIGEQELEQAQNLVAANEERIAGLQAALAEAQAFQPVGEEQQRAQAALVDQYQRGIAALQQQNAELSQTAGLIDGAAQAAEQTGDALGGALGDTDFEAAAEEAAQARVDAVRRANELAQREIELSQTEEIAAIRAAQSERVITTEAAEEQIAQVRARARDRELAAIADQQARIDQLESAGDITAEEAIDQRAALEQEVANIRLEQIEEEIAAQDRLRQAAIGRLQEEADLQRTVTDAANLSLDLQTQALSRQSSLVAAQTGLRQAQLQLDAQLLNNRLAEAEATENTVLAEQIRGELLANETASIDAQFAAREAQLEITERQAALDLERERLNANLEAINARVALEQARIEGATESQLAALQEILDIRLQQQSAVDQQAATQAQLNALAREQLDTERAIAEAQQEGAAAQERRASAEATAASSAGGGGGGSSEAAGVLMGEQITQFNAARQRISDLVAASGGNVGIDDLASVLRLNRSNPFIEGAVAEIGKLGEAALASVKAAPSGLASGRIASQAQAALDRGGSFDDVIGAINKLGATIASSPRQVNINAANPLGEVGNVLSQLNQANARAFGI